MFPIRDHNPSGRTPYVTWALIAINVAIFLLMLPAMGDDRALMTLYTTWGIVPREIAQGGGYATLLTSTFVHAGFMHLAGNMLFLWIFGDNMEDEMGHGRFLGFYLVSGIGAGLIHVLAAPNSVVPTVGASGAIAGVMGGYLLLFPKARVDILLIFIVFFKIIPIPAWIMLGIWFGMQFIGGWNANPDEGGVAFWAHAGGFVVGLVLTVPLWRRLGGPAYWSRTEGHPPHPEARYPIVESRIPKIRR